MEKLLTILAAKPPRTEKVPRLVVTEETKQPNVPREINFMPALTITGGVSSCEVLSFLVENVMEMQLPHPVDGNPVSKKTNLVGCGPLKA